MMIKDKSTLLDVWGAASQTIEGSRDTQATPSHATPEMGLCSPLLDLPAELLIKVADHLVKHGSVRDGMSSLSALKQSHPRFDAIFKEGGNGGAMWQRLVRRQELAVNAWRQFDDVGNQSTALLQSCLMPSQCEAIIRLSTPEQFHHDFFSQERGLFRQALRRVMFNFYAESFQMPQGDRWHISFNKFLLDTAVPRLTPDDLAEIGSMFEVVFKPNGFLTPSLFDKMCNVHRRPFWSTSKLYHLLPISTRKVIASNMLTNESRLLDCERKAFFDDLTHEDLQRSVDQWYDKFVLRYPVNAFPLVRNLVFASLDLNNERNQVLSGIFARSRHALRAAGRPVTNQWFFANYSKMSVLVRHAELRACLDLIENDNSSRQLLYDYFPSIMADWDFFNENLKSQLVRLRPTSKPMNFQQARSYQALLEKINVMPAASSALLRCEDHIQESRRVYEELEIVVRELGESTEEAGLRAAVKACIDLGRPVSVPDALRDLARLSGLTADQDGNDALYIYMDLFPLINLVGASDIELKQFADFILECSNSVLKICGIKSLSSVSERISERELREVVNQVSLMEGNLNAFDELRFFDAIHAWLRRDVPTYVLDGMMNVYNLRPGDFNSMLDLSASLIRMTLIE